MPPGAGPIVLNLRVCARKRTFGVERVARELGRRLVALRPDRYVALRPPRALPGPAGGQAWEQAGLPLAARRLGASLVYSPANLAPLAWPRNVVVLHDAAVWRYRGAYTRAYGAWHRRAEALGARRALRVITVSEFSKAELVAVLGLDPAAVSVIPNGVDDRFSEAVDPEPVLRRHGLGARPYVLSVGTDDGRKNLAALGALAGALSTSGVQVAWVGGRRGHIPGQGVRGRVMSLGYVADEDLPSLYAGARAFVAPSHYEGFGLTCLEAMACGTPVVAASRGALPETCGDAALLVDPDDPAQVLAAVQTALSDEQERARLRAAGERRARAATWERAAEATDRVLTDLSARP